MTLRAIAGLLALNLGYGMAGAAMLWALGAWDSVLRLLRLAGAAYLVGVAAIGTLIALALVAGIPFNGLTAPLTCLLVASAALVLGAWQGRSRPTLGRVLSSRRTMVTCSCGVAATTVFLAALFRAGRLSGLFAFDAWAFWVPKAKALYYFGGLDEQFFTTLSAPSYPLLVPVLDASAFHAMGGPDVVTMHLQFWCLTAGFVSAIAGLLSLRAPQWLVWPFVVLVLVVPRMTERLLTPQADYLLDFLFVTAALLVLAWALDGNRWQLLAATVLLCGAASTKREGLLFTAALVVAALAITADRWRAAWPWLVGVVACVVLVGLPWSHWYGSRGLQGASPGGGLLGGRDGRAWPSTRLALDVVSDTSRWGLVTTLVVAAVVLAALARAWRESVFTAILVVLLTLGGAWLTWAYVELPITDVEALNPIVRYTQATVLLAAALTPVLLATVWRRATRAGAS